MKELSDKDLKSIFSDYLRKWKWFVLTIGLFFSISYAYIRYATPQYSASAKIQIITENGAPSELNVLDELNVFSGSSIKIEDEIEIIGSRSIFIDVVRKLKLNIKYIVKGKIKDKELYGQKYPFNINFLAEDSIINKVKHSFYIKPKSSTLFNYSLEEIGTYESYTFGSTISTQIGNILIIPNMDELSDYIGKTIQVIVEPIPVVAQKYKSKTLIAPAQLMSNVINISITDPVKTKAIDIINNIIAISNSNYVQEKKEAADRTTEFINDRISKIYNNLSNVEDSAALYKSSRGIADLSSQSSVNFTQSASIERQLQEASIQLDIANSMREIFETQNGFEIVPINVGLADPNIANSAQRYNQLVLERTRLLESSNEKNPVIIKLDQQLESIKAGMQSSLQNVSNNLNLQVNSLSKQVSQLQGRIYAAPKNERALRDISRRQQTTESLYLYLFQKREEAQISFASSDPKSKIIDAAYITSPDPISPKPKIIYLASFILGLIIPFTIIYTREILDNKINSKRDLENLIGNDYPVLAEIPKVNKKTSLLVEKEDRTVLAESFRILQTNLDYMLRTKSNKGNRNIILVTSSVPGEGKTFLSGNLALTLINSGCKTLLVGADIRNPKLLRFISKEKAKTERNKNQVAGMGFTEYLFDSNILLNEVTTKLFLNGTTLDVVYSGKVPPNPAELLMKDRLNDFFEEASKEYDHIIVDSAPLLVVADTQLIANHADQILYVTKAGSTENKVLSFPLKLLKEGKIKNLSFVVNNVAASKLGYGGKYGYGYSSSKKKAWWKFGTA